MPQASLAGGIEPVVVPVTAAAVAAAVVAADRAPAEPLHLPEAEPERPEPPKQAESTEPAALPEELASAPLGPTIVPDVGDEKIDTVGSDPERPAHVPGPPEKPAETAPETPSATPPVSETPGEEPEDAAPTSGVEPPAMEGPKARELVATYTSGEHTYYMYSDNAIEADTPQGRFRFSSMDELRVFVETGTGGMPLSPPPPRKAD